VQPKNATTILGFHLLRLFSIVPTETPIQRLQVGCPSYELGNKSKWITAKEKLKNLTNKRY